MALLTLVREWWRRALGRWFEKDETTGAPAQQSATPISSAPEIIAVPPKPVEPAKRVRRQQTLSDLLDEIEDTFSALRLPAELSWLNHDTRIGLRRLGPHIPPGDQAAHIYATEPRVDPQITLSGMVCISMVGSDAPPGDRMKADFMFAVRLKNSPFHVQAHDGPVYEVGIAWRTNEKTHIWARWYVGVEASTGILKALRERWRRKVVIKRQGSYMQPVFEVPPWFADTEAERELGHSRAANVLAFAIQYWHLLDRHWKVSVRKGKDRVTWCVPFSETKHYFADRDKTINPTSGRASKILHYVREHERIVKGKPTTVREHVRGLRRFTWKGYECAITAPKFHTFTSNKFDIEGINEEEYAFTEKAIPMSEVGAMLARIEDSQDAADAA